MQLKPTLLREYHYLKEYLRLAKQKVDVDIYWLNRYMILETIFAPNMVERYNREFEANGNQLIVSWSELKLVTLHIINGFSKAKFKEYDRPLVERHFQTMINVGYTSKVFDTACEYYSSKWLLEHSIDYKEIYRRYRELKMI